MPTVSAKPTPCNVIAYKTIADPNNLVKMVSVGIGPCLVQTADFHDFMQDNNAELDAKNMVLMSGGTKIQLHPVAFYSEMNSTLYWETTEDAEKLLEPLKNISWIGRENLRFSMDSCPAEAFGGIVCGLQEKPWTVWKVPGEKLVEEASGNKDVHAGHYICLVRIPDMRKFSATNGLRSDCVNVVKQVLEILEDCSFDFDYYLAAASLLKWMRIPWSIGSANTLKVKFKDSAGTLRIETIYLPKRKRLVLHSHHSTLGLKGLLS